ncbi:MAG: feruloyl-CoA synthase, partial [Proteobacteria bacterium]|nr:feruloyl-CoA synthase [Pseudomonadota bacterium]
MTKPPFAHLKFAAAEIKLERLADGSMLLRSPQQLGPYTRCIGDWLTHWAREAPQRVFLAERSATGWRRITYADTLVTARRIGGALLQRGLSVERPVMILSDNSIDHALLTLGATHVGVPVAPISPAYSLMSKDHAKLKSICQLLRPGLIFAADGARFAGALGSIMHEPGMGDTEIVVSGNPAPGIACKPFSELTHALDAAADDAAVNRAFAEVGPDSIAKFLFTSGSTGEPKGVINTQRMLCSNQQAIAQVWHFLAETPPVIVDWLPWNHTFGANHNFNMVLRNGGTLYIDDGKPMPGLVERTVANLREIAPTIYFNVPRGFDMLIPFLEQDAVLRKNFFSQLQMIFYAAAALPQNLWERLEQLSIQERGERVVMVSAWGSTETAPMVTTVHFTIERAGVIGLPAPGAEIKMVPNGAKMELRVRGPNVTPGYWKRPDLTQAAFDEQGYYMIGDAGRLANTDDPAQGLEFDGRIAEDFKLMSGTWVHVGKLRVHGITAMAPLVQDIVIAGHDREEIGFLIFPNAPACRALCPDLPAEGANAATLAQVLDDTRIRDKVRQGMLALGSGGSSNCPARALLLAEPPSIDANEITDKGYINQRAVLTPRAEL